MRGLDRVTAGPGTRFHAIRRYSIPRVTTRWLRRGFALIVVCALAACGAPESADAKTCGEAPSAEAGQLRTVLWASAFGAGALILGIAALPDGSVVVAYEANPEEAGGEED